MWVPTGKDDVLELKHNTNLEERSYALKFTTAEQTAYSNSNPRPAISHFRSIDYFDSSLY
jgi:hypothetical protein